MSVPAVTARLETPAGARRAMRTVRALAGLRGLLPLAIALALWQVVGDPASTSFPPPSTWLEAIGDMAAEGVLWPALTRTFLAFVLALLVATVLGSAIGMVIGASARVDRAVGPMLELTRSLPPPAIVPVATLVLGVTLQTSIAIVVLAVIWPILLNTAAGMRSIPPVRIEMARILGLGRWRTVSKVVVPSLAPSIILGFRVAVAIALIVTLLVDIIGSGEGAGLLILQRQGAFDASSVWGLLLIIGIFGYLVNLAVIALERRVMRNWGERR